MKMFMLCIVISLLHLSQSADVAVECPEGYSEDGFEKGTKKCYAVFGESEGARFKDAECRRGTILPIPIQNTQNERLEKFVRRYFEDKKLKFKFHGIWLDLMAVREPHGECFKAFHHPEENQACYRRNGSPHWKVNAYNETPPEQIAGSGDCVHMIFDEPIPWYRSGPLWKRKSCDEKMPFVCEVEPCPKGSFHCIKEGKTRCMRKEAICNGKEECDDGADENGCPGVPKGCGGTITHPKGSLTSPNFPGKYGPHKKCRWTIKAGINQRISIKPHFIDIELGGDNLAIIDGETDNDKILKRLEGKMPGQKLPKVPLSTNNVVTVLFTTDGSVQENGFNLTYEAVSPENHSLTANATLQYLMSPNYPEDYDRDSEYLITAPVGSVITLQFTELNLAPGDSVIVRDGRNKNAPKIQPMPTVIVSYGNALLVSFETKDPDFDGTKRFKASYVEGCRADIKSESAELESPGRSSYNKYPKNLDCRYSVNPPQPLSISFEADFWTEAENDKVDVYCANVAAPSRVLNGSMQDTLIQNCPYIVLNFTTDGSIEHRGWRAKISHDCPALTSLPTYLEKSTNQVHVNVKVFYSCSKEGYEVVGVNPQVCGLNGKWLSEIPKCELKDCGNPKDISNGRFTYTSHKQTYGGAVEYKCHPEYHLVDPAKQRRKCLMSGWEVPLPECTETVCQDLSKLVENSPHLTVTNTTRRRVGSSAQYDCKEGYRFKTNHQKLIFCQNVENEEFGKWSSTVIPECEKIQCDTKKIAAEFGEVSPQGFIDIGKNVSVLCHSGFEVIHGSGTATCQKSGRFDTELLKCRDTDECTGINPCSPNGACVNTFGGYWCKCNTGYKLNETGTGCVDVNECETGYAICLHKCENTIGSYVCKCNTGFKEDPGTGRCITLIQCPALTAPPNGTFEYRIPPDSTTDRIIPNTAVSLRCSYGYSDDGGVRVCQSDGKWSGNEQSCKRAECPIEKLEQTVIVTYSNGTFLGSLATYSCKSGLSFTEGNLVRVCEQVPASNAARPQYRFSGKPPVCSKSGAGSLCPPPMVSKLVKVTMSSDNASVSYDCPTGYQLAGQSSSKCVAGKWNGPSPDCVLQDKERYCSIPTLPVNAESFTPSDMNYHQLEYADPQNRNKYYRVTAVGSKTGLKCKPGYQVHGDELVCIGKSNIDGTCSLSRLMTHWQNRIREIKRFYDNSNSTYINENYSQFCSFMLPITCSLEYWYKVVAEMNPKLEAICRNNGYLLRNVSLPCNIDSYIDNLLLVETRVTDRDELCRHILNTSTFESCVESVPTTPATSILLTMVVALRSVLQANHQCGLGYCDMYFNQPQPSSPNGGSCEWKKCVPGGRSSPSEPFSICHPPGIGTDSKILGDPYRERPWKTIDSQSKRFWNSDQLGHWFSRSPPICIDKQPPTFNFCPPSVDVWAESGISPIDRIVSNVTDNVDKKPIVRVLVSGPHIPSHRHAFVTPTELKKEDVIGGYLTFVAIDQDGNIALCSVRGPSSMYCAKRNITLIVPTQDTEIHFTKTDISTTRFVHGSVKETVRTPAANGSLPVPSSGELEVEAQDYSGKNKTCPVKYSLQTSLCEQWTLNTPPGAVASFSGSSSNLSATTATVRCKTGYLPFTSTYTCKSGKWSPSDVVHCLKVFKLVDARLDVNLTTSGTNLSQKAAADCLNSVVPALQQNHLISCRFLYNNVALLSRKLKKELLEVNINLQVRYRAVTENTDVKPCLKDLAKWIDLMAEFPTLAEVQQYCPGGINFTIQNMVQPVGVFYSYCFHPRAFHKNLTLLVNFTSNTTIDMNSTKNCVDEYLSIVRRDSVLRCEGIAIPDFILYSKAAVVIELGFYSKMYNITLDSLQDCWLAYFNKARAFYGKPVTVPGLTCQIPQLTANLTRIEERYNFCEPGKVPLPGTNEHHAGRYCPAGMYAYENKCRHCPLGTSSGLGKTACSLKGDVMIQCTPGLFSPTGFEPCALCPIGTYSETNMSTSCTPCPCKQKTPRHGATSRRDCGASNGMYCLKKVINEYVFNRLQTTGHPNVIASGSYVNISHNRNTSIPMVYGKNYDLSATAMDENGKTLTCNYTYSIESRFCSPDSLVLPEGVRIKECSPANAIDQVAEHYTCSFECANTTGFLFYGGVYQCSGGKWSPSRVVTPCAQVLTCPPGTYRGSDGKSCIQVPRGSYYSPAAAAKYEACKKGTSTLHEQSMSQDDCIAECKPGTYSHTGLEPCNPCEKGTYSDVGGAMSCKPCPDCSATTLDMQSQSPTDCKETSLCSPGTYSDSGIKPCKPCPIHHFANLSGSLRCEPCPIGNATWSTGSTSCEDAIFSRDLRLERNTSFPFVQYVPVGSSDNLHYEQAYFHLDGKKVIFQPPSGSIEASLGIHTVEVASTDKIGAPVSYRFQIDVRPLSSCKPVTNMPFSRNAQRLCRKSDPAGNGYNCTFTCNNGFVFPDYENNKTFTCAPGQDWKRDINIQDCAAIMRGHRVEQTFRFSEKVDFTCIQALKYKRMKVISNLTDVCLAKYPHMKGMKMESVIVVENRDSENTLVIGTVSHISSLGTVSYTECFKLIEEILQKADNVTDLCPILVRPITLNTRQTTYPCSNSYSRRNSATSLDECVFCSSGSYLNKASPWCDSCPIGTYQDEVGSTSCKKCPSGTSTYNTGSKSFDDCIVQCDQYGLVNSTIGLPPCRQCGEPYAPIDPVTCDFCQTVRNMFCPATFGQDWCFQCDILGTADCNRNNRDVPCICKPNYSGKFCKINLRKAACESSPCKNGGRCLVSHLKPERGYKCFCPAGFEGTNCEKNVDDCTASSCPHGTCLDKNGTYSCHCDQGYKGERCELPIDECYSLPCVNGFCESRLNGFYCNCFGTPFTGKFCNETIRSTLTCGPSTCLNGGKCLTFATNSTFEKCDCKNGTHGKYCERWTEEPLCKPTNPCKNGGVCVQESYNSFKCVCKHGGGFTGDLCDVKKTPCSPNPCNNGMCAEVDASSYRCSCPLVSGRRVYYGQNCEKVNPCADNPCKYGKCNANGHDWKCNCTSGFQGAYCNETVDTCSLKTANGQLPCEQSSTKKCTNIVTNNKPDFFCHCEEGWEGKNCSKDIDECTNTTNPCQNNGTCFNTPGHFRCNCTLGAPLWEGKLCDVLKKDPCTPPGPCRNGGNCTRTADGFLCSCPVEWKGETCEEDVDECVAAFPCQHGTCTNTKGGFNCSCFKGYEGKQCTAMIDMCKSSPCQNNGVCGSFLNGYNCTCPGEYTGKNCEMAVDDCAPVKVGAKPCGDYGSCVDGWKSYSCKCDYNYVGPKCHKGKLPDFDLVFRGFNSTSYFTRTVVLNDSMSVEFWVRFASYQGKETFLTISLEDLGSSSKRDVLAYNGESVTLSMFSETRLVKEPVNNADWKYVVLIIGGGKLMLYQNGQKRLEESQSFLGLNGRLHVTLGTPATRQTHLGFSGEISRLNIYERALQISEINAVVDKCSEHSRTGDVFSWLMFDSNTTNVERVEPSICGTADCSDGFKGPNCTIQIDSVPPEVVFCPGNIIAVNTTHRLSQIQWPQPKFTDNVGIARVTTNHRIGEVFAYGEYPIIYVAYDGEGNSAICQFKIFVLDEHCPEPDPPYNGMVAYGNLPWIKFAKIECKNWLFAFSIPPPPFYTCIADGKWFPIKALNQPLVFPSCSERFPPILRLIFGWLKIPIDQCSDHRKRALNNTMNMIINSLDTAFNICDGPCKSDIKVECDGGQPSAGRRKRQTTNDKIRALLSYDLPNIKLNSTRIKLDTGDFSSLLDALLKMIKEGLATRNTSGIENNKVEDVGIDTTPVCPQGSVLGLDKNCANCSRGTFYQEMAKPQLAICVNCPRGFYQDQEAQTICKPCGGSIGRSTTLAEGSHDASQCYPYCPPGTFYSHEEKACVKCRLGYYQDNHGMFSCFSCANALTTLSTGANSKNDCTAAFCPLGSELATDGRCKQCPLGTYRSQSQQTACLQCPFTDSTIYSTANPGATSEKMCSLVTCQRGHYKNADGCYPCHLGMYQPAITTNTSCIRCPKGMTTASERATSADDCQPGPVDECLFGSHDCDVNGVCTDTADSFLCACKPGYVGDGRECLLESQCDIDTCLNGGTCRMIRGTPHCNCPLTHSGERCEIVGATIIAVSCVSAGFVVFVIAVVIWLCVNKRRQQYRLERREPMEQFSNPAFIKWQLDYEDGPETGQKTAPVDNDQNDFEKDKPDQPSAISLSDERDDN